MNEHQLIPYAGYHVGPRRTLTMILRRSWYSSRGAHVNIDGSTYVLPWGVASFEVPADRPVSISVYTMAQSVAGLATVVLAPGPAIELEYRSPGVIGPPGTTRAQARKTVGIDVLSGCGIAVLVVLAAVVLMIFILVILFVSFGG